MQEIKLTEKDTNELNIKQEKQNSSINLKDIYNQNKGIIWLAVGSILVSIGTLIYLYLYVFKIPPTPAQLVKLSGMYVENGYTQTDHQEKINSTPTIPKTEVNPLNGELFTKEEMTKMLKKKARCSND